MATKISWTDQVWNPVWGCNYKCKYCYAKSISRRFAGPTAKRNTNTAKSYDKMKESLTKFEPTFIESSYKKLFVRKPSKYFVNSMSDFAHWKTEWQLRALKKIALFPEHTFQILSKDPKAYDFTHVNFPENVWLGLTIDGSENGNAKLEKFLCHNKSNIKFVSFEPLLGFVCINDMHMKNLDWVIIGSMSGVGRKPAKLDWVEGLVAHANIFNVPVFIKQLEIEGKLEDDITKFPKHLQIREFPKTTNKKLSL